MAVKALSHSLEVLSSFKGSILRCTCGISCVLDEALGGLSCNIDVQLEVVVLTVKLQREFDIKKGFSQKVASEVFSTVFA